MLFVKTISQNINSIIKSMATYLAPIKFKKEMCILIKKMYLVPIPYLNKKLNKNLSYHGTQK